MKLGKRIIHSRIATGVICWLLASYIRAVFLTSRITRAIDPQAEPYLRGECNGILAFWHGRMMMLPAGYPRRRKVRVLISHHRDGILISRIVRYFGQATINGSTSRGGSAAMREILKALKEGDNIGFTPDGPRGPSQAASLGIVSVAKLSGKPIIPVAFSATRAHHFKSWDRFMLALPFGRIIFCAGAPIMIEKYMDDETARKQVEDAMNRLVAIADGMSYA